METTMTTKFEAMIEELQALSRARHDAEVALFRRCHEFETNDPSVWKETGKSFDALLVDYSICAPERYRDFLVAQKLLRNEKTVELIGPNATIEAARITSPARRKKFVEAALARREEKGIPWSAQHAKEARLRIGGSEPRDSAYNKRKTRVEELTEENAQLKKELRAAQAKIREQAAEIAKLQRGRKAG